MHTHRKILLLGFCSFMLLQCRKQIAFQRVIFIIQEHSSKGVRKNMPKTYSFTKNKTHVRCFDNCLEMLFDTNILENATWQIIVTVVLILMPRQLTDLNFKSRQVIKWCHLYLLSLRNFSLSFRSSVLPVCRASQATFLRE